MMIRSFFNLFLVGFLNAVAFGQGGNAQNFCSSAVQICKVGSTGVHFSQASGNICHGGVSKLFYTFIPTLSFVSSSATNSSNFDIGHLAQNGSPVNSTYIIYGPFTSQDQPCDLVESFQAPILDQSASPSSSMVTYNGSFIEGKIYILEINVSSCSGNIVFQANEGHERYFDCDNDGISCENCLPKFQPSNGKYVVSAWVKQDNVPAGTTSFSAPKIKVKAGPHPDNPSGPVVTQTLLPSGRIIDGWQKIEEIIFVTDETTFEMQLEAEGAFDVYFDDIRICPNDGSAITYVYDPITLRLMAELDERNFATLYEYDEEGKLVRVKKETEKGIMTIQENRDNNSLK